MHVGIYEILGGILLFIVVCISRSVELLGAELVLPVIKIAFNFKHKESVELAAPAIWLAVLIKFLAALFKKDTEYKHRRVIDFKFATVIMPLVFIGATWGEVIHTTVAKVIESAILALVIAFLLLKSVIGAIKEWKLHRNEMRETIALKTLEKNSSNISDNLVESTQINNDIKKSVNGYTINQDREDEKTESEIGLSFAESEEEIDPKYDKVYKPRYIKRFFPIIFMVGLLIFQHLLRGSKRFDSLLHLEEWSLEFWLIMIGYTLILLLMFFVVFIITKYESTFHGDVGYEISYNWGPVTFLKVIVISIVAGMSTTAIGIGLAFLCAPLLHTLDFPEEISEHTPLFIELWVRIVATVQFMIKDAIEWPFALYFAAWVLPGALLGTFVLLPWTSTHYKTTLMLAVTSLFLALACVLTLVFDSIEIIKDVNDGIPVFNFHGYCEEEAE